MIHLKQLPHLYHIFLKDNPLTSINNQRNGSRDELNRSDLRKEKKFFLWTFTTDRDKKNIKHVLKSNVLSGFFVLSIIIQICIVNQSDSYSLSFYHQV